MQLSRAKDSNDKLSSERDSHVASEHREREVMKRMQRQLRESKEEQGDMLKREQEALQKKHDLVYCHAWKLKNNFFNNTDFHLTLGFYLGYF